MSVQEIKNYTRSLIAATAHIHSKGIIHRDIKPNNFLFNRNTQTGMLVDFGLAQYANTTICTIHKPWREPTSTLSGVTGHVVDDPRPTFKPPTRAGTRGFRSPEVLLKYPNQSIAIDVWSCGVILATMFTGRYPIFHCQEDVEALLELADIYGLDAMRKVARYCGISYSFRTDI